MTIRCKQQPSWPVHETGHHPENVVDKKSPQGDVAASIGNGSRMNKKILDFLQAVPSKPIDGKSLWFKQGHLNVYLRKGLTYVDSGVTKVSVTLSSCEVTNQKYLGKGNIRELLPQFEAIVRELGYEAILAENIIPAQLMNFMERQGYEYFDRFDPHSPCRTMIKRLQ